MFDENITRLTANNVKVFLDQKKPLLVDTLPPEHYQDRHIPGSHNACVYDIDFLDQLQTLCPDKSTPIILYGSGKNSFDSRVAAEKLTADNYAEVMIFPGGMQEWTEAGYALEGENPTGVIPAHPVVRLNKKEFEVLPDESVITWIGRNSTGRHTGTVTLSSGIVEGSLEKLRGNFILDMTSITDLDLAGDELKPVLEAHLKSDDFFFTTLFPKAKFSITTMEPIPGRAATQANYLVTGTLSLRGMHKEIRFEAYVCNINKNKLAIMAHFDLDRTRWGLIYGSARFFEHLGYHLVYDLISIEARIILA